MPEPSTNLDDFQPKRGPNRSTKRKAIQAVIFAVLLAGSIVGIGLVQAKMEPGQTRTVVLVLLAMNGIAAMVNLFRTFRPHKT